MDNTLTEKDMIKELTRCRPSTIEEMQKITGGGIHENCFLVVCFRGELCRMSTYNEGKMVIIRDHSGTVHKMPTEELGEAPAVYAAGFEVCCKGKWLKTFGCSGVNTEDFSCLVDDPSHHTGLYDMNTNYMWGAGAAELRREHIEQVRLWMSDKIAG